MTLCKQFTSDIWNSFVLKGACSFIWESNVVLLTPELWLCKHGCPYSIHNSEVSLFGAFVDPLWKKPITKSKGKGLGAQPQKRPHLVYLVGSNKSSNELGYLNIEVDGKTSWRCCVRRLTRCFMRTVQQNVFLILNRVPVTYVTDPEIIRPSIPVMMHSLDQKVMARKAKARKCTTEIAGNIQAKVGRQEEKKRKTTQAVKTTPHIKFRKSKPLWYRVP